MTFTKRALAQSKKEKGQIGGAIPRSLSEDLACETNLEEKGVDIFLLGRKEEHKCVKRGKGMAYRRRKGKGMRVGLTGDAVKSADLSQRKLAGIEKGSPLKKAKQRGKPKTARQKESVGLQSLNDIGSNGGMKGGENC